MFRWLKRIGFMCVLLGSVALNVLSLTSAVVFSALSGLLEGIPGLHTHSARIARERAALENKVNLQRAAVRGTGRRSLQRLRKLAIYQAIEVGGSYVPFLGTAVVIGGTIWELQELCKSAKDIQSLFEALEIEEATDNDLTRTICNKVSE